MEFEHLKLKKVKKNPARYTGGGDPNEKIIFNKNNRQQHTANLSGKLNAYFSSRNEGAQHRISSGLPELPIEVPLLLKLNEETYPIDELYKYGLEVICDDENGYVVVAADEDGLRLFQQKIEGFNSSVHGSAKIAEIDEIDVENLPQKRLSEFLCSQYPFNESSMYEIEAAVEAFGMPFEKPRRKPRELDTDYNQRLETAKFDFYAKKEELFDARENHFVGFIRSYSEGFEFLSTRMDATEKDLFYFNLRLSGKILRDLTLNYPFIFEINEIGAIHLPAGMDLTQDAEDGEIQVPEADAPKITIIDSGVQLGHKYLAPAIHSSHNYLSPTTIATDEYLPHGHGTRVASRILYPDGFNLQTNYQLPCWIVNAKILDANNQIPKHLIPIDLYKNILTNTNEGKIFNSSINYTSPCRTKHMSSWASEIDALMNQKDILVIQSAGNLNDGEIKNNLENGRNYPDYLNENHCRIADPAQSMFALTVGSLAVANYQDLDKCSIESEDMPSSFTRSGFGLWGAIKPDVVEYGGGQLKDSDNNIYKNKATSLELARISPEGPAYSKDAVGTSFSAPKVSYIASEIQKLFPNEPALLYKALIVHSAEWPSWTDDVSDDEKSRVLRWIGYGKPNLNSCLQNNEFKITFITSDKTTISPKQAHIYEIPIPQEINTPGESRDIKITVTLAYTSSVKRTRRKKSGYLSSWLDWVCAKPNEPFENFETRVFKTDEDEWTDYSSEKWAIGTADTHGLVKGASRNNSAVQKDWIVINSNKLPDKLGLAVRSHPGWNKDLESPEGDAYYSLVISIEAINEDVPIYNTIKAAVEVEAEIELEI